MALDTNILHLDGIWTWYNAPNAAYDADADKMYFGALTRRGRITIQAWDFDKRLLTYGIPRDTVLEVDDHNNPALLVLDNGEILAAYSQHNGDSFCARTAAAGVVRAWDSEVTVNTAEGDAYAQLWQAADNNNTVYWFYRRDVLARRFRTSTDRGDTWSDVGEIFANSAERPYTIICANGSNRLDFLVTTGHPNEVTNSLYHFYMEVDPTDGSREYFQSDGTSLGDDTDLPFAPSDGTLVYSGATRNCWNWDAVVPTPGSNPVLGFTSFTDASVTADTHHYHQARWNGSAWVEDEICEGGDTGTAPHYLYAAQIHYSGGIACDPNDANTVYVSRKYGAGDWRVEKWTHSGTFGSGTWSKAADTSGNTGTVNARPWCVRGKSPTHVIWWEGTYTSFTSYATKLRMDPAPDWRTGTKAASPSYQANDAPPGVQAYFLLNEGSGNPADLTGNGYGGTLTGTPTWNAAAGDDFGAFLSGFTTGNYVNIDTLAAALGITTYSFWMAVLGKNASGTTGWTIGCGNSGGANAMIGLEHAGTTLNMTLRDDAGGTPERANVTNTDATSGDYFAFVGTRESATQSVAWSHLTSGANAVLSLGTLTHNVGAIGALRRNTVAQPYPGEIHAVLVGWGTPCDPHGILMDLLRGQFAGTFEATGEAEGAPPIPNLYGGIFDYLAGGIHQ